MAYKFRILRTKIFSIINTLKLMIDFDETNNKFVNEWSMKHVFELDY